LLLIKPLLALVVTLYLCLITGFNKALSDISNAFVFNLTYPCRVRAICFIFVQKTLHDPQVL